LQVMLGQRLQPKGYHHMGHMLSDEQMNMVLNGIRGNIARTVDRMPMHQDFVNQYCLADEA